MRALGILLFALPPLYLLMLVVSLAWPVEESALAVYRPEVPRLVASDLRKWNNREQTPDGQRAGWKAYVLFPSVLHDPRVVTVTVLPDGARVVSESRSEFWIRFSFALASLGLVTAFVVKVVRTPVVREPPARRPDPRDERQAQAPRRVRPGGRRR